MLLGRLLLDPRRLVRQHAIVATATPAAALAQAFVEHLEQVYEGALPDGRYPALRDAAIAELTELFGHPGDPPACLDSLVALAVYPIHLRIILEELPVVLGAVRADEVEGTNARSNGSLMRVQHGNFIDGLNANSSLSGDGVKSLKIFDRAGIGREQLGAEMGSDAMIATVTAAAGVSATVVDSDRSGLAPIRPVTRALRGAVLVPYWFVIGLVSRWAFRSRARSRGFCRGRSVADPGPVASCPLQLVEPP